MPSTSKKQHNFMAAIANNPSFAKKVGIPQSVGKDFSAADKGKTFNKGGATMMSKKAPNAMSDMMARRRPRMGAGMPPPAPPVMPPQPPAPMGMKKGGKVRRFEEGGITEKEHPEIDNATRARALAFVAKNEPSTTNDSNADPVFSVESFTSKVDKKPPVAKPKNKFSNANNAMSRATNARNAAKTTREQAAKMTDPGNKAQLIKAAEDLESKAVQFQRGADFARSTTKFAKGGMAHGGMHKMPNGKMMKNSAMNKGGMPMKDGKPAFMMGKKKMMGGGMAKYAKGGGIESRGKTKGTMIRMAAGGSVSARADGIAQRGKTRG